MGASLRYSDGLDDNADDRDFVGNADGEKDGVFKGFEEGTVVEKDDDESDGSDDVSFNRASLGKSDGGILLG